MSNGKCIPLLYPGFMLFMSILYIIGGNKLSDLGAIPTPLTTQSIERLLFAFVPNNIISILKIMLCK